MNVRPERLTWALFGGLVLLAFVCFAPDLRNALLDWDDGIYILQNAHIAPLSGSTVAWAFGETYCGFWAPLTWLSLAVDRAVWGADPLGYHLTNNLLHALNTGLFFLIAVRLLRRGAGGSDGLPEVPSHVVLFAGAFAAAVFGLHPLRVESVAWAAERKDVLAMAFGLGAVLTWLGYVDACPPDGPAGGVRLLRSPRYWASLALFALSLMAKAMMVTLPVVLLALDWCPLGRLRPGRIRWALVEKLPMVLLAALSSWITTRAMAENIFSTAQVSLPSRALVALDSVAAYLRLSLAPVGISPVYMHPGNLTLGWAHVIELALLGGITAATVGAARRWPALLAAWIVFLVALAPFLGFMQNGPQAMAARFTYFPSTALCLLLGAAALLLWSRAEAGGRRALSAAALLSVVALAALTIRDIGAWRSNVSLWTRVIELQPHAFGKAYFQRAAFLSAEGRFEEALADAEEARAIAERKGYPGIQENHGQVAEIRRTLGDLSGAIEAFGRAVDASEPPWRGTYRYQRAELYEAMGKAEEARCDREAAAQEHRAP